MGVHVTFVRSVDLDEWTQRQVDAMRIGGNDNCKKFFRKHGCTDLNSTKKYTSKAAVAYRAELAKLVEAEAVKRGEGVGATTAEGGGASSSLLDNADASMKKDVDAEARSKLDAARANGGGSSAGTLQPSAKLASQMSGTRGRLATPTSTPPVSGGLNLNGLKTTNSAAASSSSGGPKLVLRKPSTASASSRLLKKGSSLSNPSRLRVNKIAMTPSSTASSLGGGGGDDGFEDVETTQKNIENQKKTEKEEKKRREEEDAKLARELQDQLNGLGGGGGADASAATTPAGTEPATPTSTPANGVTAKKAEPPKPKVSAHQQNMNKLSAMNSDFFSGM